MRAIVQQDWSVREEALRSIVSKEASFFSFSKRGEYVFTFRQDVASPLGVWLRILDLGAELTTDGWETVFDVDEFSKASGQSWIWAGVEDNYFCPDRVLIRLARDGADDLMYHEFDLTSCSLVEDGLVLAPSHSRVSWAGRDSLLVSSAYGDDASRSGWPATLRLMRRDESLSASEVFYRAHSETSFVQGCVFNNPSAGPVYFVVSKSLGGSSITSVFWEAGERSFQSPDGGYLAISARYYVWLALGHPVHADGSLVIEDIVTGAEVYVYRAVEGNLILEKCQILQDWIAFVEVVNQKPRVVLIKVGAQSVEIENLHFGDDVGFLGIKIFSDEDVLPSFVIEASGLLVAPHFWLLNVGKHEEHKMRLLFKKCPDFDVSSASTHLLKARSSDGTEVPYRLVLPNCSGLCKEIPIIISAYGGFGLCLDASYDGVLGHEWIQLGGGYVQAYIRGGGEFGPKWHFAAKTDKRSVSFEDLAAVAQDLVARGFSSHARIGCFGQSNGALLCGVMLTRFPNLFGAIWATSGLYDLLKFTDFPAGNAWVDEYGNPSLEEDRKWLQRFSPLHNIPNLPVPPALIVARSSDDRVHPSHSRRFAAALQRSGHTAFFWECSGGHGAATSIFETVKEVNLGYSFFRRFLSLE
jgi:prolyl oligopeptidase